ncbi:MAG: tRNA uridine-5-carboxymethylaminomethyl(34) synthesis enzyme MnmG [Candidatus Raymondbacteria bacterium RifOxyC12_full_50_8]|uniref:tRNA uridine 5-carboxymethylaminomethyl modification enzyme MnmG n=1 Tax=Candidatus Raymondbacteria bacterium RIFOXYD12_FULL_49_13 TaxID=1817890 RepID=A0A1F7FFH5_UNCRA|nr:MAG: tRNA uridine-5-carboxymethylaminomethyl(34) synthesis enzyme MnmG [Candidatus Raymondbacteria bacterium RIFOXYA2_FULL_49_16]OGK01024.1 MAG: tRNA uridine-5-carboxymethylaminomethyl(34) synthesis enzyme MnmG [Candidatus Raymondbacteria bacterium RifOxyB12_full_50_8]OGK03376.1 MAG: tRNA uridine-5-carboxymethylaminomethyl(34) synthesis enzyme MnmG [Candidatus Raymondbacteria bacterium RifOxyC12_full_50_8]OGK05358.1 MAG: tRNA uridine-5-carboxymethylaminomethyl(34) synthesis enzyme MnmG [Candi
MVDVVVIGGGHAGCEAAYASFMLGLKVVFISSDSNSFGKMSCNPAIGGLAKGHIVREIDALGGLMGKFADKYGIQFRMLNMSKGPAVWGPRAQIDKDDYSKNLSLYFQKIKDITIIEDTVIEIVIKNKIIIGVKTIKGNYYRAKTVILSGGTFLNGYIHIGREKFHSGRIGESAVHGLTKSLTQAGIISKRLKTGTPARIKKESVNYSVLTRQEGDIEPKPFSYSSGKIDIDQVPCYITRTTKQTHDYIRKNFHHSPMASGEILSIGPRYCPSIETKLKNFKDKESHQLFIEPEGRIHPNIYLNGFSNCLPREIQDKAVRTIPGLEDAVIDIPAYAIEYDFFPPTQLKNSLESKIVDNLFFAGQVNGTSGYEEAAAQGLMAGINAWKKINKLAPFILKRSEAYIGVLIDDLITKGTDEPYRMFTSRAEFRLLLRQDNADERLMKKGFDLGLVEKHVYESAVQKWKRIYSGIESFKKEPVKKEDANPFLRSMNKSPLKENTNLFSFLKRPEINWSFIQELKDFSTRFSNEELLRIEILIKYDGYIKKQQEEVESFDAIENIKIPEGIEYSTVPGLTNEAVEKLTFFKPSVLGQAGRISGINPSDVHVLHIFLKYKYGKK